MKNIVLFNSNMQQQGSTCVPKNFEKNLVFTCQRCLLPSALLTMPAALLTGSRRECLPSSLPKSVSHRVHNPRTWCRTWSPCYVCHCPSLWTWSRGKTHGVIIPAHYQSSQVGVFPDMCSPSSSCISYWIEPMCLFLRRKLGSSLCFILCVLSMSHGITGDAFLTLNRQQSRITTSVSTEVVNQSTTQTELT